MSSIYRKGRDGYFYYQAYVYNFESKKKDKRIFHSLSTKNLEEAKKKKYELDSIYKNKNVTKSKIFKTSNRFNLIFFKKFIFILIIIFVIILFIDDIIPEKELNLIFSNDPSLTKLNKYVVNTDTELLNKEVLNKKGIIKIEQPPSFDPPKRVEPLLNLSEVEYIVERVDLLPGSFEQGKVSALTKNDLNREKKRLLCEEIASNYPQFSNIIICLYTDNLNGRELIYGNEKNNSIKNQEQTWLAMYTYNSVEGAYFDDNPDGYLDNK